MWKCEFFKEVLVYLIKYFDIRYILFVLFLYNQEHIVNNVENKFNVCRVQKCLEQIYKTCYMITLYAKQKKRHRCTEQILDSVGEGEGGMIWENSIETSILSKVKQISSPGWMHEISAQGWCTGKTQRDGMGREVGGGIRMGSTCKSMVIHVNLTMVKWTWGQMDKIDNGQFDMAKTTTIL